MHISLESPEKNAIQAYSDEQVRINSIDYATQLIVSKEEIIRDIQCSSVHDIDEDYLALLLKHQPELVIIGHNKQQTLLPTELIARLSQRRIGIELMSIGAACRTYNVLLSESRKVTLGLIF